MIKLYAFENNNKCELFFFCQTIMKHKFCTLLLFINHRKYSLSRKKKVCTQKLSITCFTAKIQNKNNFITHNLKTNEIITTY